MAGPAVAGGGEHGPAPKPPAYPPRDRRPTAAGTGENPVLHYQALRALSPGRCRKHLGPNFRPRPIASHEQTLPPTSDTSLPEDKTRVSDSHAGGQPPPASLPPAGRGGDSPRLDCTAHTRTNPGRLAVPTAVILSSTLYPKPTLFSTAREGAPGPGPQSCYGKLAETAPRPGSRRWRKPHAPIMQATRSADRKRCQPPARTGAGVRTGHWDPG